MSKDKIGYGLAGCGGLLVLLCAVGLLFTGFHSFVEPGGRISQDEAMPGFLGSCCCGLISLGLLGGGIYLAMKAKKEGEGAAQGGSAPPGSGGPPPM